MRLRKLLEEQRPLAPLPTEAAVPGVTWGLAATKVINTRLSGANIKVAGLDTGFDLSHPDFAQRQIVTKNFVGDQQPFHDGVGHGTHYRHRDRPTAPGERATVRHRIGGFDLLGRVLDDNGRGGDFNILEGIDWAIEQGCDIVPLSLGSPLAVGRSGT